MAKAAGAKEMLQNALRAEIDTIDRYVKRREQALALGLMVSQRNMGLMAAMVVGALPDKTWLYFALAVFPYCIAPQIVQLLVRRSLK